MPSPVTPPRHSLAQLYSYTALYSTLYMLLYTASLCVGVRELYSYLIAIHMALDVRSGVAECTVNNDNAHQRDWVHLMTFESTYSFQGAPTSATTRNGESPARQPGVASRAVPHADKVGAGALERIPRESDLAGGAVEVEDGAVVRVLVGHDQPLAALVELEVARRLAARVEDARERDEAGRARVAVDAVHGDRVVAAVGGEDEIAARVDRDAAARVELAREG